MAKESRKTALKRLSRQRHNAKDSEALFRELAGATDRSLAIIYSSLVEDALRSAITRSFRSLSPNEDESIFTDYGPLSSFYGKILVGYAMNVITETQRVDLVTIKDIRNAFAHANVGLFFNDKKVSDVCMLLRLVDIDKLPPEQQTARWRFFLSCSILLFQLSGQYTNMYLGTIPIKDLIASSPHNLED